MYDIYAAEMAFEQCAPDKEEIDSIIPYAVIHFVLSGEGYINGKKITKNTAFISFENCRMNYYPSKTDPWSYIYLRLKGRDVKRAFLEHNFSLGLTVLPFGESDTLFRILSLCQKLTETEEPDAAGIIANAVLLLFQKCPALPSNQSKPRQHAERIAAYMEENYYKKITVGDMAKKFYLNKNYLCAIFLREIGLSPKQYLQKIRMERAAFLLRRTDGDVSLIARSVGYEDALLFSKMFKRYYSLSPRQYRCAEVIPSGATAEPLGGTDSP